MAVQWVVQLYARTVDNVAFETATVGPVGLPNSSGGTMPSYYVLQKTLQQPSTSIFARSDNHEVILTSESYVTKQCAQTGIASCQSNSPYDSRYERHVANANQPCVVLNALNG